MLKKLVTDDEATDANTQVVSAKRSYFYFPPTMRGFHDPLRVDLSSLLNRYRVELFDPRVPVARSLSFGYPADHLFSHPKQTSVVAVWPYYLGGSSNKMVLLRRFGSVYRDHDNISYFELTRHGYEGLYSKPDNCHGINAFDANTLRITNDTCLGSARDSISVNSGTLCLSGLNTYMMDSPLSARDADGNFVHPTAQPPMLFLGPNNSVKVPPFLLLKDKEDEPAVTADQEIEKYIAAAHWVAETFKKEETDDQWEVLTTPKPDVPETLAARAYRLVFGRN